MAEVRRSNPDAFKQLAVNLAQLGSNEAKVGWFNTAYPDGGPFVAYVAAIHEFGCPEKNIPPRLGLRTTAAEKKQEWRQDSEILSKQVLAGKMTGYDAMSNIADKAVGAFVDHISSNPPPPLKQATIASRIRRDRGSPDQALNYTGQLLTGLTSKVQSV